jgi:hypothetical protein
LCLGVEFCLGDLKVIAVIKLMVTHKPNQGRFVVKLGRPALPHFSLTGLKLNTTMPEYTQV